MEKLLSGPLVLNDSSYELCIYTFTCDAPARALFKGIVQQHTGYCACERGTINGTSMRGRIVYDRTKKMLEGQILFLCQWGMLRKMK